MRTDIKLDGWMISAESNNPADAFMESLFFTGNGRMGVRGYSAFRPSPRPIETGLFIAGVFDEIQHGIGITDFVNLPTPVWETIQVDGAVPGLDSTIWRELDLRTGTLTLRYRLVAHNIHLDVMEQRFFPLDRPDLLVQRLELTSDTEADLVVRSGIENTCCNSPIPDDQVKQSIEVVQLTRYAGAILDSTGIAANYATTNTKIQIRQSVDFHTTGFYRQDFYDEKETVGFCFHAKVKVHTPIVLEKVTHIGTSRDVDPRIGGVLTVWDYASLREENRQAWEHKWNACEIQLDGDDDAQTALRYAIYQLVINCSAKDDTVSIGARGLTHTRYKGCYFWDTDLFMEPFYLLTDPEAARSLMGYRINTLPQAKKHAEKMSGAGARYPWMVSYGGTEQCESWDIGCSEVHVTADVAYATGQYLDWTKDQAFFLHGGAEMLIETARFWGSRYSPEPGTNKVNLLFCKGPDEYCGITNNNLFTNMMVQHNLDLAIKAAEELQALDGAQYRRLSLSQNEIDGWKALKSAIKLPRDPLTGHWRTDDTFHLLEPVDLNTLKSGDVASYHKTCFDRVQRYKVVKQADVLLLMSRLRENFTEEERLDAWADFEPLCLHDSTLSFASHALFAAQNGLTADAEKYFHKALFLDIRELMENTGKEGLHLACLGETWQTVIFGFAGLHIEDGALALNPHLPENWTRLSFCFYHQGHQYKVDISPSSASIK